MSKIEIILPAMGEGIIEATITKWLVAEGSFVEVDKPLIEVATDKVDSEIPSPVSGILTKIIYKEGEIPKIGEVLAIIEDGCESHEEDIFVSKPQYSLADPNDSISEKTGQTEKFIKSDIINFRPKYSNETEVTPFIRFLAKSRGIKYQELIHIKGSGLGGRIIKDDLNNYIKSGRRFNQPEIATANGNSVKFDDQLPVNYNQYIPAPGEEVVEMDRTRKLIAAHMVNSKRTSPHVTSMLEIDVTHLVQWRMQYKEEFYHHHGVKLTYTPVIVMACIKALKDFPGINISVSGEYIIYKKNINIGVATALPDGNLIVPVIKEADKRSFVNVALQLANLADRARNSKLEPSEIKGSTFTITNLGHYDNISGTPIINQPEVAILAVGAIKRKPGVVIVDGQETIGIRDILVLSLTYDHRVVDGSLGGSFLKSIGDYLLSALPEF
jgi:2-oxoglutarate dehydrogenase E2 component (dihydrolipoamide succinyltransferase)